MQIEPVQCEGTLAGCQVTVHQAWGWSLEPTLLEPTLRTAPTRALGIVGCAEVAQQKQQR